MKTFYQFTLLLLTTLLVVACSTKNDNEQQENQDKTPPTENIDEKNPGDQQADNEPLDDFTDFSSFFLTDGAKAHYEGVGNEFAELNIEVHHIGGQFIVVDEDNGGIKIRKIYRIDEDKIVVLAENPIDLNEALPNEDQLAALEVDHIYLQAPLEMDAQFGDWTIIDTAGTIETPYGDFENVLVIESIKDGFTNRKYLVPEYGEVVRESTMETADDQDFIVISSLKSIE